MTQQASATDNMANSRANSEPLSQAQAWLKRFTLSDMRIGNRLILLLVVPLVAIIWLASEALLSRWQIMDRAQMVEETTTAAVAISGVVHEFQKERGASAVFLVSNGARFSQELADQKELTDSLTTALNEAVGAENLESFDPSIRTAIGEFQDLVSRRDAIRQQVASQNLSIPEMAKYYTGAIAAGLKVTEIMAAIPTDGRVVNAVIAWHALQEGKERAGQERAAGATGFTKGSFPLALQQKFKGLIDKQDTYFTTFLQRGSSKVTEFFEKTMNAPVVAEVQRMRDTGLSESALRGPLSVNGSQWFATITQKIDLMKQVEDVVVANLVSLVGGLGQSAQREFAWRTAICLAALAITIAFAMAIVRGVAGPLNRLTTATQELAKGNHRADLSIPETRDEIGVLIGAVKVFRQNLIDNERLQAAQRESEERAKAEELRRREEQRAAEAKVEEERRAAEQKGQAERRQAMLDLATSFETQVGQVVTDVSSAASQLQSTAASLSANSEESNRQATTVAAASEEATANVQTVASAAEELSASIEEISRQVGRSSEIAVSAVKQADETNEKVQGLSEAAQKIDDVVNLINDIASQTNLLALNATIEAARAGEAGKGFAVVAAEVKSLATQTARATDEIAGQIAAIQMATGNAVSAIQTIGNTIGEIRAITADIESAVDQQGAATREIATNVQQAAGGTQEVSSNIAGISQAADETGIATNQVLEASNSLVSHGDKLRAEVDNFLTTVRAA